MTINVHDKNDRVRISGTFKDIAGSLVDPSTVTLKVTDPSGNTDTYTYGTSPSEIERSSTGSYYKDIDADEEGDWFWQWRSTGSGQGVSEGQFVVQPTSF